MPFFSIITPTYNRASIIEKTIVSVLSQNFTDFEFIIVDDGSTDDTELIVKKHTDSRIKYIYQKNGERGKARNAGVKAAQGDYVFFLDSDDLIYPDHLQHAFEQLTKKAFPEFFHSRYEEKHDNHTSQVPALKESNLFKEICKQNKFACQFFLKHSIALAFPFCEDRNLKIGEDWEVILKIAHRYQLHFSNRVTAAIVHHGERSMEIANPQVILTSRDLLLHNLKGDNKINATVLKNVFAELTTLAALSAAIANNKKQAFKLWIKGIKKRPSHLFKRRTLAIFKKLLFNGQT